MVKGQVTSTVYKKWGKRSNQTVIRPKGQYNFHIRDGHGGQVELKSTEVDNLMQALLDVRMRSKPSAAAQFKKAIKKKLDLEQTHA